jgi:signal peptidase II
LRDNGGVTPTDDAAAEHSVASPSRPQHRRVVLFAVVALAVLALDVLSKVLVVATLDHEPPKRLLGGAIYLDVARNSGAAFSLGTGFTVILTLIALAVVAVIVRTASRMRSTGWAIALGLILGGAVGNLVDRIFREPGVFRGHVVDWISLFGPNAEHWPIFNLADSAIVCGAILAAILSLFGIPIDGGARGRE